MEISDKQARGLGGAIFRAIGFQPGRNYGKTALGHAVVAMVERLQTEEPDIDLAAGDSALARLVRDTPPLRGIARMADGETFVPILTPFMKYAKPPQTPE